MAEITPITSSPFVAGLNKVRRDEGKKNNAQKQPQPEKAKDGQSESDGQSIQHIDEIV